MDGARFARPPLWWLAVARLTAAAVLVGIVTWQSAGTEEPIRLSTVVDVLEALSTL